MDTNDIHMLVNNNYIYLNANYVTNFLNFAMSLTGYNILSTTTVPVGTPEPIVNNSKYANIVSDNDVLIIYNVAKFIVFSNDEGNFLSCVSTNVINILSNINQPLSEEHQKHNQEWSYLM